MHYQYSCVVSFRNFWECFVHKAWQSCSSSACCCREWLTFQKAIPRETYCGRLLIWRHFRDNCEIVSVLSWEIVCGGLLSVYLRIIILLPLRVAPWCEYYKLSNKLVGFVDKWCSFCRLNNNNSLSTWRWHSKLLLNE